MPNAVPSFQQLAGRVIDGGRLRLVEPLGNGSGGVVFRAVNLCSSPTSYAVKCMIKAEEGSRQRAFQEREIRFHTSVSSHPHVVTLHRVVEEDGYIFLVLDYCDGGDLFKYLTKRGTFVRNNDLVKKVFVQLIDAVEDCHRVGVFHRDIKPENVMCSKDGSDVKLGDFGLSTDSEWSKNFGAGTAGYMSPECIDSEMGWHSYSNASNDVWSLGVIFTSMVSGHNPWRRAITSDDCFKSYIRDPNFFRKMLPISPEADDILRGVFAPCAQRLSLAALRQRVLSADTFFLNDAEIAAATPYVQLAAASYLCPSSAAQTSTPSFQGLVDVEVNSGIRHGVIRAHSDPLSGSDPPISEPLRSGMVEADFSTRPRKVANRPPPPPPQRMPSFKDFMRPSSDSSDISAEVKKKLASARRSHSPVGFLKRIVEKIMMV